MKKIHKPKREYSRFDWRTVFLKNSGGISSKRVCGLLGWITCICIFICGFIMDKDIPEYGEIIAITSATMLGIDCVTSIWNKNITKGRE